MAWSMTMATLQVTLIVITLAVCVTGNQSLLFQSESRSPTTTNNRTLACYYSNKILNESLIQPDVCTHIIFASALISPDGIVARNHSDIYSWRLLVKLKEKNPKLKVMISACCNFETVVGRSPQILQSFLDGTKKLLQTFNLDGVDLDWETPGIFQRYDFEQFQKALSAMLRSEGKLLSAAIPNGFFHIIGGYSVEGINKYFDFVTVMTYDYHAYDPKSPYTDYNSPLRPAAKILNDLKIIEISPSILLLGFATYGRSWKLADSENHGLHAKAVGLGSPGPYLNSTGFYTLADVCLEVKKGGTIVTDDVNGAEYMYRGDTWVSFNGMYSAQIEADWLRTTGFGGVGFFALEYADFKNVCGYGAFPVLNRVKKILEQP